LAGILFIKEPPKVKLVHPGSNTLSQDEPKDFFLRIKYVADRMCEVLHDDMTRNLYAILAMGGVWVMVYTSVLYSLIWMQSGISGEESAAFDSYASVENKYCEIMGVSFSILFFLTPALGIMNDKCGGDLLIPATFFVHGMFTCAIYYGGKEDFDLQAAFGLGFFTSLLTVSAALAVITNYARDLPADVRGTMMGVLAFGSQLLAAFYIMGTKAMIHATIKDEEKDWETLVPYGIAAYIDFLLFIVGTVVYVSTKKTAKAKKDSADKMN
jgi:hypothetical protein